MKTPDRARARAALPAVDWPAVLVTALRRGLRRHAVLRRRCVEHGSTRAVHGLRVETRRLLALADLIGAVGGGATDKLRRSLRRSLRDTAKARDTAVQLQQVEERIAGEPALRPFRVRLRRGVKRAVRALRDRLRYGGKKLRRRARALAGAAGASGAGAAAAPAVVRTVQAALATARAANRDAQRAAAQTHRARLALKRLRYLAEALRVWVPGITAAWLEQLRRRQHLTGEIHDLQVLARCLARYVARRPGERIRLRRARRWLADREKRLRRTVPAELPVPPAGLRRLLARRGAAGRRAQGGSEAAAKTKSRGSGPKRRPDAS